MTVEEVLAELQAFGNEQTKRTFMRHGAVEPIFGVKIGDLKTIQKRVKADHELALALYDTGNSDAMYLAGLIAEPAKMTKAQLRKWVKTVKWFMQAEYIVAWVAAESKHAADLAAEWIESPKELIAVAGWATYSSLVGITPDANLDLALLGKLLDRVKAEIATAPNRVRYTMNAFVICVGSYVLALNAAAKAVGRAIGKVEVDTGDTDCKVPDAVAYIEKVEAAGKLGRKRKAARC